MTYARQTAVIILSLPILVLMLALDILKVPFILILIAPIFGFLDLIYMLRGEDSMFFSAIAVMGLLGILIWMDIAGIPEPAWLERL